MTADPDEPPKSSSEGWTGRGTVLLGTFAAMHPDFSILRALAAAIADAAEVTLSFVGGGSNDLGAWMAGAVPHRVAGGGSADPVGRNVADMLAEPLDLYLTLGVEPEMDTADPARTASALGAGKVIALSSYLSPWLRENADILLPISAFVETSGTFVNIEGVAQSFKGAASPPGEARPGWKVLRVLGNLVDVDGFDYLDSGEVRDEVLGRCADMKPDNRVGKSDVGHAQLAAAAWERIGGVPMYAIDALVRRAQALRSTPDAWGDGLRMNASAAASLGLDASASVRVVQDEGSAEFKVRVDDAVPDGCIWLPTAVSGSELLGPGFGPVSVEKV